jgi:hypothetical protein
MRLESSIVIGRSPEEVGRFLADVKNVQKWDRGVGSAEVTNSSPGVGFEFETLGPAHWARRKAEKARMAYRITHADSNGCTVALTSLSGNARFFKAAQWHFRLSPAEEGTLLFCCAEFRLKWLYSFLGPILYLKRDAIQMDLEQLKQAIDEEFSMQIRE